MRSVALFTRMRVAVAKAAVSALGVRDLFGPGREWRTGAWQSGAMQLAPVGELTRFSAVWACVTRIANDIGKLEPVLQRRQANGTWQRADDSSPFWAPLRKPNGFQNRVQFLVLWLLFKLLFGNVYAIKQRDARGMVTRLYILDPRRVTPMVTTEGDVYYSVGGDNLARLPGGGIVRATEIIHDRGATLWHPLIGVSPIMAAATSATMGLHMQSNSATFFQNMSRPSGMLTAPGEIDETTAKRLKTEWEQNYSADNIGRLAVLGDGLKYEPMTIPANDAQLIEQLNWTAVDVARAFSVPLYKINAGPLPNTGAEAAESQYYTGCLQILIEAFEACMGEGLSLPSDMRVQLDLDGLLRMDKATQVDMLAKAVGGAIMMPDEARAALNLAPAPGGNQVYLQQQNYSLAALAKRDQREDPFAPAKPPAPPPAPTPPPADTPSAADAAAEAAADAAAKALHAVESSEVVASQVRALLQRLESAIDKPVPGTELVTLSAEPEIDEDQLVAKFLQKLELAGDRRG